MVTSFSRLFELRIIGKRFMRRYMLALHATLLAPFIPETLTFAPVSKIYIKLLILKGAFLKLLSKRHKIAIMYSYKTNQQ